MPLKPKFHQSEIIRPAGLNPWLWGVITLIIVTDILWLPFSGIHLDYKSFLLPLGGSLFLASLFLFYTRLRPFPNIAYLAINGSVLLAWTAVAAIFSYLATTLRLPLIDQSLKAFDKMLGLDWPAMDLWLRGHHLLFLLLAVVYASPYALIILLMVILHFRGNVRQANELIYIFALTSFITIALSIPFPAAGAFAAYAVHLDTPYLQQYLSLRDGTFGIITFSKMEGLVQFPSFHVMIAVFTAWCARGLGWFTNFMGLNAALMIIATPFCGGHHFADVVAGIIIVSSLILICRNYLPIKDAGRSS